MTSTDELTHALVLAILAPDQERVDRAIEMAEEIAANLTPKQIASAKRAAIKLAK
jgi:enoyl-CoA hydratase/carnithine racemase